MSFEDTEKQLREFSNFIKIGWDAAAGIEVLDKVSSIVVCGMGGSGVPGDVLQDYLQIDIPIFVVKGYTLPKHLDKDALVFILSYSGNTEETLACFRSGLGKGSRMVGITAGGQLQELCEKNKTPLVLLPKGIQPRAAIPLLFFPILRVLHNSKLIEDQEAFVQKTIETLSRDVYAAMGNALAEKLKDKIPIIYASEEHKAIAYRWKTQLNENAKVMAFSNAFSELNHNEIVGFEHLIGEYYVIMLQDEDDNLRIKKRMKITKELIKEKGVSSTVVVIKGTCKLSKLLSAIHIGDWVSAYLAKLYGIDPMPVEIIEKLKKLL